jgi:hypothetical protein
MPLLTYWPNSLALPALLANAAVIILKLVDFPAPFGPKRPNISLYLTTNDISLIPILPLP